MNETGEASAPAAAADSPARHPPRRGFPDWMRTPGGAIGAAAVGLVLYFLIAQIAPGLVAFAKLVFDAGGMPPPTELEPLLAPYIPHLTFAAMAYSILFLAILHRIGWLAPPPEARGRPSYLGVLFWIAGLSMICMLGNRATLFGMEQLGFEPQEQEIIVEATKSGGLGFVLAIVLFAPVGEELFFRRFLFTALGAGTGRLAAYAGSALVFALIHLNPSAMPAYLVIGLCAAFAYEKTGMIWAAIGVHVANNATGVWFWGAP